MSRASRRSRAWARLYSCPSGIVVAGIPQRAQERAQRRRLDRLGQQAIAALACHPLQFIAAMVPDPVRVNPIEPILEFDRTDNPFRQTVIQTPIEHENGVVAIPNAPGLGIEINRDALIEFKMRDEA